VYNGSLGSRVLALQDVAVCGQYLHTLQNYVGKCGVQVAADTVLVHVTDVTTIKVLAADNTIPSQLILLREHNIQSARQAMVFAVVLNV
jgi:hypothetical protein